MDGDDYYMKKVLIDFLFGFLVVTTVTICEFIVTLPFGEPWKPGSEFVDTAKKFLGVPYLWGGVGAGGIDCSGLTYICCRVNGVDLPRDAQPQYDAIPTSVVPTTKYMRTGDLVFFGSKINSKTISHVGIYIGNNQFIHSSSGEGLVTITSLSNNYYIKRLVGVKRVF